MQPPRDPFGGVVGYRDAPWPRPRALWGRNLYDDALVFERAPFFSSDGFRDEELIRHYSAASGELPRGLSLAVVRSRDFTHRLVVEPALLRPEFQRNTTENRVAFVDLIRQRMRRTPYSRPLPRAWDFDTWAYRTEDDRVYVASLKQILDNLRLREEAPSEALMAWGSAILPDEFAQQPERVRDPAMHNKLKFERRMPNRLGVFVAYEWLEVTSFERSFLNTRYLEIPAWFAQYEVPADFIAEVPPCVVYCGRSLLGDPQSARWRVFSSEWLAIVAKQFLWSAYDGRLFVLPTMVVEWLRRLDLSRVLGSTALQGQLQSLLDLHEDIDWSLVPYSQGHHYDNPRGKHFSPGRRCDAGGPNSGNWVRTEAGTLRLSQPEYLRVGGPRVADHSSDGRRVRRRGVGFGKIPSIGLGQGHGGGPAPGTVVGPIAVDVVGAGREGEAGPPLRGPDGCDPTVMSDAELRLLLWSPGLRAQLQRMIAEESSAPGTVPSVVPPRPAQEREAAPATDTDPLPQGYPGPSQVGKTGEGGVRAGEDLMEDGVEPGSRSN